MGISLIKGTARMRSFAVIIAVLGLCALPAESDKRKLMHKMAKYNLMARCFGEEMMTEMALKIHQSCEECGMMQQPVSAASLPGQVNADTLDALRNLLANPAVSSLLSNSRGKRQAGGLLDVTEEDKMEFLEDLEDFKEGMDSKIGNLSCVLQKMDMLKSNGDINMDHFSYRNMANKLKYSPAGSDSLFLKKMADGFSDCYDISRSWPQMSLDRNPLTKEHGRHMIFFECAKKVKVMMCTKFQLSQWMELFYGKFDATKAVAYGLPDNKYDASAMKVKVMYNAASDEMKFVDDFFWQKSKF